MTATHAQLVLAHNLVGTTFAPKGMFPQEAIEEFAVTRIEPGRYQHGAEVRLAANGGDTDAAALLYHAKELHDQLSLDYYAARRNDDNGNPWIDSWTPTDWDDVDLTNIPKPIELRRLDGSPLLYGGRRWNVIHGQPEAAKTWLALFAISQYLIRCADGIEDRPVVMLDYEDGPEAILHNLELLGVNEADVRKWVIHFAVANVVTQRGEIAPPLLSVIQGAGMVVLDSALASAETEGLSPSDPAQVSEWRQRVLVPIERIAHPETVLLLIDHDPMGNGGGSRPQAYGGQAKYRAYKGLSMRAEAIEKPAKGREGRIALNITKDTLSQVRAVSEPETTKGKGERVGVFVMKPLPGGKIEAFILNPDKTATAPTVAAKGRSVIAAAKKLNAKGFGVSLAEAASAMRADGHTFTSGGERDVVGSLVADGELIIGKGRGGAPGYWLPEYEADSDGGSGDE